MLRTVAASIAAGMLIVTALIGLVAIGTAASLRPRARDLAPVDVTAVRRVSIVLPPYHQRADPELRVAVTPDGRRHSPNPAQLLVGDLA